MATARREAEATRADLAFHAALTRIGLETLPEALDLWDEVPTTAKRTTASSWLSKAVQMVMTRRRLSRDLALAYYRLARALRTGTTIPDPYNPEPTSVTLGDLRREFAALAPDGEDVEEEGEDDPVLIEEIERLTAESERLEREAEEEARTTLEALGPANLEKKTEQLDPEAPASEVDAAREAAHAAAGARQAAGAERVVMDGARGELFSLVQRDKRVLGWARYSTTGTPCGWCAMLISRGAVYKTEASAQFSEGDLYHDNCHCAAIPLWTREQYAGSMFELNRYYQELWPQVTRGLSGKAAVSAWRRFIRQEQKAAAQAARSSPTTNVQEA